MSPTEDWLKKVWYRSSLGAQQIKDLALSLQQPKSPLVRVQSLAWECSHATGQAKKKKVRYIYIHIYIYEY